MTTGEGPQKSRLEIIEEAIAELQTIMKTVGETMDNMLKRMDNVEKKSGVKKALFGGKKERHPITDAKTGTVFISMGAAGRALAEEFGEDPNDNFSYYKIQKKLKDAGITDRLRDSSPEEAEKVIKEEEERIAAIEREAAESQAAASGEGVAGEGAGQKEETGGAAEGKADESKGKKGKK